jgi:peptidoglycan/LPS O-acetylase OafA/YrhL
MSSQTTPTGRKPQLPALTGLRIFGALGVFLLHSLILADPLKPSVPMTYIHDRGLAEGVAKFVWMSGIIGVSFFFVLSGFVITWASRPGQSAGAFIRRRLMKIFPNHVVTWVVAMLVVPAAATGVGVPVLNLFLLHPYFPDPNVFISVNSPSWSLGCEMLFYVLFPVLIRPVRRIPVNRLWVWAVGLIAAMVAVALINYGFVPNTPKSGLLPMAVPQQWFGYIFPVPRLLEFGLGMMLARMVEAGAWPKQLRIWHAGVLCGVAYLITNNVPAPFNFILPMIVPIAVLIATVATADLRGDRTYLRKPFMVWLGKISFGFYLCQGVVLFQGRLWLFGGQTFSTPVAIALTTGLFAMTCLVGWILYQFVEEPMVKRFSVSRKARALREQSSTVEAAQTSAPSKHDSTLAA